MHFDDACDTAKYNYNRRCLLDLLAPHFTEVTVTSFSAVVGAEEPGDQPSSIDATLLVDKQLLPGSRKRL